ncbi:seven-hairpin glycosidase [Coniochaeta sp. PMI_546]|nr:seven-hairpin glycosidase [Coniochaeta sp. PMI_546]
MPRFRRYRVFVVSAFIILVLLFQVGRNANWEPSASLPQKAKGGDKKETNIRPPTYQPPTDKVKPAGDSDSYRGATPDDEPQRQPPSKEQNIEIPVLKEEYGYKDYAIPPVTAATKAPVLIESTNDGDDDDTFATKKGASKSSQAPTPAPTTVHWQKQSEFFPVPTESLIKLPTGEPKHIPTIQAAFAPESAAAKEKRERRLAKVKAEAERAWGGYKKYAWTHDEVQPVSKKPRDPFCGWAATLVDALDTLWIMDMRDEFDDAVKAVADIDFTTTPYRNDIPVFETIIRYLGGLLAAYDVSGGHKGPYKILLDKALELAEILMGVFDTPNRMPVLYYNWRPEYASQPHRASPSSSVAELGSMSMEFTRLAQLTGEDRFYDAVARITDAFEEWQRRGTALDGIFPQNVDASGCNRTALNLKSRSATEKSGSAGPAFDSPGLALEREQARAKADQRKRGINASTTDQIPALVGRDPHAGSRSAPLKADGALAEWDCPAQGLVSGGYGSDSYSMGGSQDSAYEYFPKQYLLLGGLEPKYRTMHEKTVKAVKKYLLYRPMIKDESRDLLFSARAYSYGATDDSLSYDYEVTHLTCFLGGMFGLGGKIFGSDEDVEIGKKLADGCAWAYEIMPTGIMPESSVVMPCKSIDKCAWNETAWHEKMDPNRSWRDEQMADYLERHKIWKEEVRNITEQAKLEKEKSDKVDAAAREIEEERELRPVNDTLPGKGGPTNLKVGTASGEGAYDFGSEDDGAADSSQTTLTDEPDLPPEPIPPQTHEEYVKDRIRNEHLPPGFISLNDKRYILRPEAIESVWYMYRITGDPVWQEKGWRMFESVIAATTVSAGHSAIDDVSSTKAVTFTDNMESFWLAETLKYFYLLFATPDTISLDDWVLNTEAHPFRRPP